MKFKKNKLEDVVMFKSYIKRVFPLTFKRYEIM
jgi:hypothetical protein